ncbi:GTPase-activating protein rrc-1-like [Watersipora subatra]|uniref:GTPase-activating protein rrc-1-like n=1 Tax=Watersipora subatra TaxID=2589382 RepID=UPI00355BD644
MGEKPSGDVPVIVQICNKAIEERGIVHGIYRVSAGASKVHNLRSKLSSTTKVVDLKDEEPYTIAAVLKEYFRNLPGSLLGQTEMLNEVGVQGIEELKQYIERLSPSYYRTAQWMFRHLSRLSEMCEVTSMTASNLAIVWAPNLFRSESTAPPHELVKSMEKQRIVVEKIITNYNEIFSPTSALLLSTIFNPPHTASSKDAGYSKHT